MAVNTFYQWRDDRGCVRRSVKAWFQVKLPGVEIFFFRLCSMNRRSKKALLICFTSFFFASLYVGIMSSEQKHIIWVIPDGLFIFVFVHIWLLVGYFSFKDIIQKREDMQPLLPFFFCLLFLIVGSFTQLPWLEKWLEGIDLLLLLIGILCLLEKKKLSKELKKFWSAAKKKQIGEGWEEQHQITFSFFVTRFCNNFGRKSPEAVEG